jgi:uncharacterized membrane protein
MNNSNNWVARYTRSTLGLALLVGLSFLCFALWVTVGAWAGVVGGVLVAFGWACWDRYVLHK